MEVIPSPAGSQETFKHADLVGMDQAVFNNCLHANHFTKTEHTSPHLYRNKNSKKVLKIALVIV